MEGEDSKCARRFVAVLSLTCAFAAPLWARDPALTDREGQPRSERAQWVYRIVAKWGGHVQEAYRRDPRRWAESMAPSFAQAPLSALRNAAQARSFTAMNDALLATPSPAGLPRSDVAQKGAPQSKTDVGTQALGDPAQDLVYVPVTPCRILDTRVAGGPIPANSFRDFDLTDVIRYAPQGGDTSNCNVGDKGSFAAAALNITVVSPNIAGYITAFPYLASQPTAATINYVAGDIRNSLAIVRLDQSAAVNEFSVYSFAQTHLVADIVGYFREPEATALECINTPDVQASSINGPFAVVANACPAGYAAMSGGCRSDNISTPVFVMGSFTDNSRHHCQFYLTAAGRPVSAFTRCCRTPGRLSGQ